MCEGGDAELRFGAFGRQGLRLGIGRTRTPGLSRASWGWIWKMERLGGKKFGAENLACEGLGLGTELRAESGGRWER